jgi:carbamoyl-phosphate synthase large subunit
VGKGILDVLEGRREGLTVIGTSFGVESPGAFRCDEAHLTRHYDGEEFVDELADLIDATGPDVIIPARDPDIVVLAQVAQQYAVPPVMVGSVASARLFSDKLETARFAQASGLPAVPTIPASSGPIPSPAVAKPRTGSGSIGVRFLLDDDQVLRAGAEHDVVLQPLIGPAPKVPDPRDGWPLFWQAPLARQGGVQGVILPDGSVAGQFTFEVSHEFGRVARQWPADGDTELAELGASFIAALSEAGWRGPTNVACIHDGEHWLCLELNGRFTGGTAARTAMGFDEVRVAINGWLGEVVVPEWSRPPVDVVLMQPAVSGLFAGQLDAFAHSRRQP